MSAEPLARIEELLLEGNALRREAIALQKANIDKVEQQLLLAKAVNEKAMTVNQGALEIQKRARSAISVLLCAAGVLLLWLAYRLFF
jgi:hypothetical protein